MGTIILTVNMSLLIRTTSFHESRDAPLMLFAPLIPLQIYVPPKFCSCLCQCTSHVRYVSKCIGCSGKRCAMFRMRPVTSVNLLRYRPISTPVIKEKKKIQRFQVSEWMDT